MDEIRQELKQKELDIKNAKIEQRIGQVEERKKHEKQRKEVQKMEQAARNHYNKVSHEIQHETKVQKYLLSEIDKEKRVEQALVEKKNNNEQLRREKDDFYASKVRYGKELGQHHQEQKLKKVDQKH